MLKSFVLAGVCGVAAAGAGAEVVYDSLSPIVPNTSSVVFTHDAGETSSTDEISGGLENESQYGHSVVLAGSDRFVSLIELRAISSRGGFPNSTSPTPVSFATTLRIYSLVNEAPGQLLWEGTSPVVTLAQSTAAVYADLAFSPAMTLPDTFVLCVSESQIQDQAPGRWVGTSWQNTPGTIGTSGASWYGEDTTTDEWSAVSTFGATIQMRITAVPTGSVAGVMGVAALWGAARRR